MSIQTNILGPPGGDNAAYIRIDSGQRISRLLFDCGAGAAGALGRAEVQVIDLLLFSHLHMDHVAGFDGFFRATYGRIAKPNVIYGPPGTGAIMQHRMQGFLWNLEHDAPGAWDVFDIHPDHIQGVRFHLGEAFARAHQLATETRQGALVLETPEFHISACAMEHMTPSLAYIVREQPRVNIEQQRLAALGLRAGQWLQRLKQFTPDEPPQIQIEGRTFELQTLRAELLTTTPGNSVAYCTDFLLDAAALDRLAPALRGCDTLICESQYRAEDADLAARNYHMTVPQAARLARSAQAGELILFHVSDRYRGPELADMLAQARAIFPNTHFPNHWRIS